MHTSNLEKSKKGAYPESTAHMDGLLQKSHPSHVFQVFKGRQP